ncbi:related to serine/threonine-specific protein kinase [Cephalotrichum gorgonifer]|uniref:Related to serine/threonine-specific protein kinase n=1 Tax=Cephalotrichum gorgonifer TaxID=2041049 RepID=A0AAE8MZP2_9PEZI|nr:related to serine/threonine-specific protein kinase [Cephalotrichum gorgonifer]
MVVVQSHQPHGVENIRLDPSLRGPTGSRDVGKIPSSHWSHEGGDLTSSAILEETESESEAAPNEPVTPISGRQSREFTAVRTRDNSDIDTAGSNTSADLAPSNALPVVAKHPLAVNTNASPGPTEIATRTATSSAVGAPLTKASTTGQDRQSFSTTPSKRPSFSSTAGTLRKSFSSVSSKVGLFRRNNSKDSGVASTPTSDVNLNAQAKSPAGRKFSLSKSGTTTRSNTPPSPGSPPLEMTFISRVAAVNGHHHHDEADAASDGLTKKHRASTGLGIRGRAVNFVHGNVPGRDKDKDKDKKKPKRRANSFDGRKEKPALPKDSTDGESPFVPAERLPWPYPPDQGTGAKARRMSLSLPDDFTVDVAELLSEFEYQSKLLGRHGKHLGKGATSKVTLMMRKGYPCELYAVKEFRGKSGRESQEEYEKKIKSEYSIAKSLHHPNIVETVRLCTDHGRWNHVMEYCSEGDLFGLVEKGYLKQESRAGDRHCLFKQLVQGVGYLHSNGIAHRDIKLENLLITKDSKLKITDFGVSEVFSGSHPGLREAGGICGKNMGDVRLCAPGICGSEPYIAPEVLAKDGRYDPRALDVWGSAIIMLQLIFGGSIWAKADENDPNYATLAKGWADWNAKHMEADGPAQPTETDYPHVAAFDRFIKPPALRRLLLGMLNPDTTRRTMIADVLANRWVKNIECCQLESYEDPAPIDVSKKNAAVKVANKKIYCHNHLPPGQATSGSGAPSLGIMPGKPGY